MLFNSLDFAVFLPVVFALYWMAKSAGSRAQNLVLLIASYFFYGWWDWRFLALIVASTLIDYWCGLRLEKTGNSPSCMRDRQARKRYLYLSLAMNLGLLGYFKYANFFLDSLKDAFTLAGTELTWSGMEIVLPVGISFYTFQSMAYTIDVSKKRLPAEHNLMRFALFIAFFPQLVAGPIERAQNMLPQLRSSKIFDRRQATEGLRQILWGLFAKMVIADNCAIVVSQVFEDPAAFNSASLGMGTFLFSMQIYGDFAGYSLIAIGTAKLFGIELSQNFGYPYFAHNLSEFWSRWHITLTRWFRDYIYIPLGGNRAGTATTIRNILIVFLVSGLWHGAGWTFIIWGGLHGLMLIPFSFSRKRTFRFGLPRKTKAGNLSRRLGIPITFALVTIAWIFFRAPDLATAGTYLQRLFGFTGSAETSIFGASLNLILLLITFYLFVEYAQRRYEFPLYRLQDRMPVVVRWSFYSLIIWLIGVMMTEQHSAFIYFQF